MACCGPTAAWVVLKGGDSWRLLFPVGQRTQFTISKTTQGYELKNGDRPFAVKSSLFAAKRALERRVGAI